MNTKADGIKLLKIYSKPSALQVKKKWGNFTRNFFWLMFWAWYCLNQ